MGTYQGARTIDGVKVLADGQPLDPRTDLNRFTDRGFEWTYEGVEPAQLALAILSEHLQDDEKALKLYQPFTLHVVANFDNEWEMTSKNIDTALNNMSDTWKANDK